MNRLLKPKHNKTDSRLQNGKLGSVQPNTGRNGADEFITGSKKAPFPMNEIRGAREVDSKRSTSVWQSPKCHGDETALRVLWDSRFQNLPPF